MKVVEGLNEAQREAVCHGNTPLLVIAGAGSGKTRVIVHRIAYLIDEAGVPPGKILAVTFTNKAADEMEERVKSLLGSKPAGIWLGTFHSICVRILRREGKKIGFPAGFTIYDRDDSLRLIKSIVAETAPGATPREISGYLERISSHKSNMVPPDGVPEKRGSESGFLRNLYAAYQKNLMANSALDFDDLIMKVVELFVADPDTLESYRRRFSHILVDEYQDTNRAQYKLVSLLAGDTGSLYVVGDDDQSIYGWRGADIRNILEFEKDFPGAGSIVLDVNYRSTEIILNAASSMISHNRGRKPKKLRADKKSGDKITLYRARDDREEARKITDTIKKAYVEEGFSFSDFAILYRTNAQSRLIEEALRGEEIPHMIIGSLSFYRRKEIKDLLAYLRVLVNPADTLNLLRITNVPPRGIGQKTIDLMKEFAEEHGHSYLEAMDQMVDAGRLKGARAEKLASFGRLMKELIELAAKEDLLLVIREVLERTGYIRHLEEAGTSESRGRLENVDELVRSAEEFTLSFQLQGKEAGLQDFLERTALNEDWDEPSSTAGGVSLLTLHNAKGLEFPFVFVTGLEEGLLPWGGNGLSFGDEVEEERRLFYVGMTRAKTRLCLSHAMRRMRHGRVDRSVPSRFIEEIPQEMTDVVSSLASAEFRRPSWSAFAGDDSFEGSGSVLANPSGGYRIGERIYHSEFGGGDVVDSSGYGEKLKLTVEFDFCGLKKIYPSYTNLRREDDSQGDSGG